MTCRYCGKKVFARGLCAMHYQRKRLKLPMEPATLKVSRLSAEQVRRIVEGQEPLSDLAREFKMSLGYLRRLRRTKVWPSSVVEDGGESVGSDP